MLDFVYYPTTQGHFIMASILRVYNKSYRNTIILDELYFTKQFIRKIKENGSWDLVYVIKKYSKLRTYFYKNIFFKRAYSGIFDLKGVNFIIFSFGSEFVNTVANSICDKNNIFLSEDGILPYYGLDCINEYAAYGLKKTNFNKFKTIVREFINRKVIFDMGNISGFLVMQPEWLPKEITCKYEIEKVDFSEKTIHSAFDELTTLYRYESKSSTYDVDIVFFDDGSVSNYVTTESERFEFFKNVFNQFPGMTLLIKLRPLSDHKVVAFYNKLQREVVSQLVFDYAESEYPWEIIYYNNSVELENVTFMGMGFSTAFISSKKYFNVEHDVICFTDIYSTEQMKKMKTYDDISKFIAKVKRSFIYKTISTPSRIDEINKIGR